MSDHDDDHEEAFVYRPPHLEGDDQSYKPLFPEAPVMRATAGVLPTAQEQNTIGFGGVDYATPEQLNWDSFQAGPAPLDFGDVMKKGDATQPEKLFGNQLQKPSYVLEPVESKQPSALQQFQKSLSYPGVSFQTAMPQWNTFKVVASAFESIKECDCRARPQDSRVDGFIFSGTARCEFAASLVCNGEDRWTVQLQRVFGSSIPFTNLVENLFFFLSRIANLSNVASTEPPYDVREFSAGAAAIHTDLPEISVDSASLKITQDDIHSRLFEMVKSDFIEVQREGWKALADLSSSAEDRNTLMRDGKLANQIVAALVSPDVELKWSGSCMLANMALCPAFCRSSVTDILATLFDLLQPSSELHSNRVQRNVLQAIERTLAHGTASAFRPHIDTLQKLNTSRDSAVKNIVALVLATMSE